jgi:hypothetical protein
MGVSPLNCAAIQTRRGKEKEHTTLEERVLLDLLGTVGTQSALRVTTQQPCDEIPCILPISSGNLSGSFKIFLYISDVFSILSASIAILTYHQKGKDSGKGALTIIKRR